MATVDNKNICCDWLLDGGSSTHITFDKEDFIENSFQYIKSETIITDGTMLQSKGMGNVKLRVIDFNNEIKFITFKNVKCAPKLKQKIISESQIIDILGLAPYGLGHKIRATGFKERVAGPVPGGHTN